jgi:hypothetical protein
MERRFLARLSGDRGCDIGLTGFLTFCGQGGLVFCDVDMTVHLGFEYDRPLTRTPPEGVRSWITRQARIAFLRPQNPTPSTNPSVQQPEVEHLDYLPPPLTCLRRPVA